MTSDNGSEGVTGAPEGSQDGLRLGSWPQLPDTVTVHPDVDLGAGDPSLAFGRRQCIASRVDGKRCGAYPPMGALLCNIHAGLLSPAQGAHALADKRRKARDRAETIAAQRALGTRALVAAVLVEEAEKVEATVRGLLADASTGDRDAARLLISWLNQALGQPTERVEQLPPVSPADLDKLDTRTLEALVARGRDQGLRAV